MAHQVCGKCRVRKPLHDFHKDKNSKTGRASRCRDCVRFAGIAWRKANPIAKKKLDSDWYRNNQHKTIARAARWKRANPDKVSVSERKYRLNNYMKIREKLLVKKYGITFKEYDILMDAQQDCCAICERTFGHGNAPDIDHCHRANKVRGILCSKCNRGLGHFDDDPVRLHRAADYLLL